MRSPVLGNQRLLVNLDQHSFVRDIYFKRVGQENHVLGRPHRIGVWHDGKLSWLDEPGWTHSVATREALCSTTTIRNDAIGVTLTVRDLVLHEHNVLLRTFKTNSAVRIFYYHYFFLYGDGIGDTAGYDPIRNTLFHYKRNRYFMIGALREHESVLADYTVSQPMNEQDAWRDAYDGVLSKNPIAQGHVDSCIAFDVKPGKPVTYTLCAAQDFPQARALFEEMRRADRETLIDQTVAEHASYATLPASFNRLKQSWREIYQTSLLLIRAHTDTGGAIVAGADSENMLFNRDTYCYAWGRDNTIIARAMDLAGKHALTRTFYEFMRGIIEPEGFYMHKHHPDGSLGSSWQAWVRDGKPYLPIQEDETALVLWSLKVHHDTTGDDYLNDKYEDWIARMIDFLLGYIRDDIMLPKDSWDLWEERQGIHTWTVAAVIAGLQAGEFFARRFDDGKRASQCKDMAERLTQSMLESLYSPEYKRLIRRLTPDLQPDLTIDAADLAPFLLGVLPPEHEAIVNTVKAVEENLRTPDGGIARYQGDYFHRKTEDAAGNPWVMCTLWVASWHITQGNWERADELIEWVVAHATSAKLLGEQMHPFTGEPLAVCPLTQAHAQFMDTVMLYVKHRGWQ